ncbi:MAG: monovalent cation/H(+) antiporter subunit G [Geminicoccaceae bacterium]|nr:monovalent cation/H(+) antiporter subunit G [Geminicoccaceae bacterium]MCB9945009.1 monovalent cation/H(+) antiporter subunit G [Geminicoccaceae bacterium]
MEWLLDIVSAVFLIPGCLLLLIGGFGLLRLRDVFARMHSAGMIDTLGLALILIGLMFKAGFTLITFKLFAIIVFVFYTSPAVTHALARAAIFGGVSPAARQIEADQEPAGDNHAQSAILREGGEPSNS